MIEIVCIKIPETSSELFELGRKYKARHIPGLGLEESKGYWIDDWKGAIVIYGTVSKEDFITLDKWRELQLNLILDETR